ncbi:siderophore biosynthesis protein-like protein [Phyllosticta citriasiana]|uniref:Siderophore biosynthesis protein-like protein n=1 Tax=Phyllosticta citriasiana TaxID=595635 RepID=A0ABR1KR70_9PEZI
MASSTVHLPNGQTLTVIPVFGGLQFKVNELSGTNNSPLPPGWSIVLHTEDENQDQSESQDAKPEKRMRRYTSPTLQGDHLYISTISNPSSNDFKPPMSPTRQIAMMLWSTLWWYFHQPEPKPQVTNSFSKNTAQLGKPKGDWRINISREGIFKGRVVLPKLERMGLIASEDSSVGVDLDEQNGEGWLDMFVSRRAFWQLDPRLYLFTLSPSSTSNFSSENSGTGSPAPDHKKHESIIFDGPPSGLWSPTAPGPFHSSSHLPTFYPPGPPQYVFSNNIRHPLRPKPPRQGETFYMRYIPSVGQHLSFRVASASPKPQHQNVTSIGQISDGVPNLQSLSVTDSDTDLLHKWMNDPRVSYFWGEQGPREHQEAFLKNGLRSKHCFPVIGCWDGKPFGYFEIYWVKEDNLGKHLGGDCGNWDRGIHLLIGEQEFRGSHRVKIWLSALIHYCFLADSRTETVMLEPRVDNEKLYKYLLASGFYKEREVTFAHKQSNLMKIKREAWEGPAI